MQGLLACSRMCITAYVDQIEAAAQGQCHIWHKHQMQDKQLSQTEKLSKTSSLCRTVKAADFLLYRPRGGLAQ